MTAAGLGRERPGGRDLRLRGRRDAVAERRHAARPQRLLLPLQRARPRADRRRQRHARLREGERRDGALHLLVRGGGRATRCATARAARSPTRSPRAAPTGSSSGSTTRATSPIALATAARQQRRLRRRLGHALRSDAAELSGQRADRRAVRASRRCSQWSASDGESGAPAVSYAIDGGARVALRGQACSWLCGTLVNGSVALDLARARRRAALGDGATPSRTPMRRPATARSRSASIAPPPPSRSSTSCPMPRPPRPAGGAMRRSRCRSRPPRRPTSSARSLRVYGPVGRASCTTQAFAGALTAASIPASALTADGAYELDVVECDGAGHCATSSRAALRWDGSAPPAPADATGLAARPARRARRRAHDLARAGRSRRRERHRRRVHRHRADRGGGARAGARRRREWEAGVPGASDAAIPAAAVRGAAQVCLAVRPVSGAGLAAASAGVRCALVDEQPPEVTVSGALRWSGGAQTVGLAVSDASGAAFSQVLLDGAPVARAGGAITVAGEGAHVLRAVARDGAGNETVVERALGVDASAARRSGASPPTSWRARCGSAWRMRSRASRWPRCASAARRSRRGSRPTARTAIARVPAGLALDGAAVGVRVQDASSPANASERSATLPARTAAAAARPERRARPRERPGRRRRGGAGARLGVSEGRACRTSSARYPTGAGGDVRRARPAAAARRATPSRCPRASSCAA